MPPLPGSWFYRLRRRRGVASGDDDAAGLASRPRGDRAPTLPAPPPCSPNRASYYVPSRDRGGPGPAVGHPKRRDTQFPRSPQPGDIVFDVVTVKADRFDGIKAMPELKLRPIVTKKMDGGEEGASRSDGNNTSPTARVRRRRRLLVKASGGRKGSPADAQSRRGARRRWLRESLVVVKESADPGEDFLASMAEMIAAHDDVRASPAGLEELLACYLALNATEHHRAIVAAFTRAWLALGTTSCAKQHGSLPPSQLQA